MTAGWVAVGVRARALAHRRLDRPELRSLSGSRSLADALAVLSAGPYGHDVRPDQTLEEAQRGVVATVLWTLRVLAGWSPRAGVTALRVLAGTIEAANVAEHALRLSGAAVPEPYRLGGLATAWPRLAATTTLGELRRVLAGSPWGDPGAETPREIAVALRAAWCDRLIPAVPGAAGWAQALVALLVAREVTLGPGLSPRARELAERTVGRAAAAAGDLAQLRAALPAGTRWALAGAIAPSDLWRAEAGWWSRVERDGLAMTQRAVFGAETLVGAVALLAADAVRVRAALQAAARGGDPEGLDVLA